MFFNDKSFSIHTRIMLDVSRFNWKFKSLQKMYIKLFSTFWFNFTHMAKFCLVIESPANISPVIT